MKSLPITLMMIETARLIIRRFAPADLDALATLRADEEVMRYIHTVPQTRDVVQKRIETFGVQYVERGFAQWAVTDKETGVLLGWCGLAYLDDKPPNIEIGYGFGIPHWGKGYATEAARACLRYGFEELNVPKIAAVAMPENSASRHVMEKCGLKYLRDSFHWGVDVVYYEIKREDFKPAAEPYKLLAVL
ncbi:MAG: GNAT family N-acetyltransferase [Pyrinomonadaceae bacterium MAG19_C2-C3]|nr:GNAT family N-acetyltransferase [Pyrinomonadaceae bacterium MAG19_C2-C3]